MFEIKNLSAGYDAINVLWDVSMHIPENQLTTIVGPNGAGKTTLLRALIGLIPVKGGQVLFKGQSLSGTPTWEIVERGIVMVPEGRMVFREMTVEDNLIIGAFPRTRRAKVKENLHRAYELFPRLQERRTQLAGSLSGGEAQMLALGRALMAEPQVMLIDEPSLGLAPVVVLELFAILKRLRSAGITIVLVEQNTDLAVGVADRVHLMQAGKVLLSEDADKISLQRLHELYFASAA